MEILLVWSLNKTYYGLIYQRKNNNKKSLKKKEFYKKQKKAEKYMIIFQSLKISPQS